MTKQEMLDKLVEKARELSEDEILELMFLADKKAQEIEFPDEETQIKESIEDFERGDVYTLDEVMEGAGKK